MKNFTKYYSLVMMALAMGVSMVSCGGGDSDGTGPIDIDQPASPVTNTTEAEKYIDASYTPTQSEIQQVWTGEYKGWDNNQETNTNIKRMLTLDSNGRYTNVIQGVLVKSGKTEYVDFEKESGTYTYNSRTKTITYVVSSDEVLDYGKQEFDKYTGKKFYDHTDGSYTEKVQFSQVKDGQRSWITKDTYLQSLTDRTINIAFAMVVKADREERR